MLVDVCCPWERASGGGELAGTSLDEFQLRATKALLSHRFGLVQGPPGTGKTFVGLMVVRTLLRNAALWSEEAAEARRAALAAAEAAPATAAASPPPAAPAAASDGSVSAARESAALQVVGAREAAADGSVD